MPDFLIHTSRKDRMTYRVTAPSFDEAIRSFCNNEAMRLVDEREGDEEIDSIEKAPDTE